LYSELYIECTCTFYLIATVACFSDIAIGTPTTSTSCGNGSNVTTSGPTLVAGADGCDGAVYEITYSVADDCGGSASCTQTYTLSVPAPSINCPANATVTCFDDIIAGTPTTSSSCGNGSNVTVSGPTLIVGTAGCDGAIYTMMYTVNDNCGGSASCTQTFTLNVGAPTISCPGDAIVTCVDDIVAGTPSTGSSCGQGSNVTTSGPTLVSGSAGCDGAVYQITYTVADDCGGSASCTQNFTLSLSAPTISCPGDATVQCLDDIAAGTPVTSTSCSQGSNVTTSGPVLISGNAGCTGAVYQITYTVADDCGDSASCTQNFTLNVPTPTISCPGDAIVQCVDDIAAGTPTTSSSCGNGSNVTTSGPALVSGTAGCDGAIYEITYTVADACNGSASCTQRFTLDVPAPTISCPGDAIVSCVDDIQAGTPVTNSGCGVGGNVTTTGPTLISGVAGCDGAMYQLLYTFTDQCGQTASCTQNFALVVPAPSISCPGDATVQCVDDVVAGTPTTSTNCSQGSNFTTSGTTLVSGTAGCTGAVYQITYTVTDDCGGSASCTQTFTLDVPMPTISCPGDAIVNCVADIVPGTPSTGSSCSGGANVTTTGPVLISGSDGCTGAVYQITYTVTDDCGGSASCVQRFSLVAPAPSISCPGDAIVTCVDDIVAGTPATSANCSFGSNVTTSGPVLIAVTDGCSGAVYQITYTVTDDCGGSDSCTQDFTLSVPAPSISCPLDQTVSCISDIAAGTATSAGNCSLGSNITTGPVTFVSGNDGCSGAVYSITYTASDDCGGSASCTQFFTINAPAPTITCPTDDWAFCLEDIIPSNPTVTGGCGIGTSYDVSDPILVSGTAGCLNAVYQLVYTVEDDCGNTASCVQEWLLEVPGPFIVCPADVTVACVDDVVSTNPQGTAGCNNSATTTTVGPVLISGTANCDGAVYEFTHTVTDNCGSTATCTERFIIDAPAPGITCPADVTVTCIDEFVAGTPVIGSTCGLANGNFTVSGPVLASGTDMCNNATYHVTYSYFDSCTGWI